MPLKDLSTIEGTKTVLETKISVQDIGSVKWYHNDRLLTASDRVQMVVKGSKQRLVLARTHASDEGHYKLMVSRAETSCRLSVQGKNNYDSIFSRVVGTLWIVCLCLQSCCAVMMVLGSGGGASLLLFSVYFRHQQKPVCCTFTGCSTPA